MRITLEDVSLPVAVDYFERYQIKFIDCLLASSRRIQEERAAIVSYNRDFDKPGVRRVEPRYLLVM